MTPAQQLVAAPAPPARHPERPAAGTALGVVDLALRAATAYQRPDLARRLAATRRRLAEPACHVLVAGEFKQGKSTLVNALVWAAACPVDDDVATAVPTLLRWAAAPVAALVHEPAVDGGEEVRVEIPVAEVAGYVTESRRAAAGGGGPGPVRVVEIGLPSPLLQGGLVLVDTPGVGGLGSTHSAATIGALPMADALLFVSDASQEYSQPELEFLATARRLCPNVTCLLTKVDFYPDWRTVAELDRHHLAAAGIDAPVIPLSSDLHIRAGTTGDAALDAESGFPALLAHLRDEITGRAQSLGVRVAAATLLSVVGQLEAQFEAQRQALADPAGSAALMGRLGVAKEEAERLRTQVAKWQQTLGDGIADIASDVDHDFRTRMRDVLRDSEEAIDAGDPADVWDEFEPWVYRRVTEDVAQNYTLLQTRAGELAALVAEHFGLDRDEIHLPLDAGAPADALAAVRASPGVDMKLLSVGQKALTAVRGGYGGVLMFGMVGQWLGLAALTGPGAAPMMALGMLMGRKQLGEEQDRALAQRRAQAKSAVRQYVDDASFNVGKDSRDTLRRIQRQLRDHFAEQAEEFHRSTTETLLATQQAAQMESEGRARRLRDVEAELARLADLRQRAAALAPDLAVAP